MLIDELDTAALLRHVHPRGAQQGLRDSDALDLRVDHVAALEVQLDVGRGARGDHEAGLDVGEGDRPAEAALDHEIVAFATNHAGPREEGSAEREGDQAEEDRHRRAQPQHLPGEGLFSARQRRRELQPEEHEKGDPDDGGGAPLQRSREVPVEVGDARARDRSGQGLAHATNVPAKARGSQGSSASRRSVGQPW